MSEEQVKQESQLRTFANATVEELAYFISQSRTPEKYATDAPFSIIHKNFNVESVEEFMPIPARVRRNVTFSDVESFIDYFNEFKVGEDPKVFVTTNKNGISFLAVIDFDQAGKNPEGLTLPRWGSHRCSLEMKYHPDYADLRRHADTFMSQNEFALFVEENLHLFEEPLGADMLELAQELKGIRNADWSLGERLSNGARTLNYNETIEATAARRSVTVPEYITLRTPLYEGFEPCSFKAAFRWRLVENDRNKHEVGFAFRLLTKLDEREAQDQVKAKIKEQASTKLFNVDSFSGIRFDVKNSKLYVTDPDC